MIKNYKKNKKGFTIVELVIVIAVIAILAAVLIPTFSNIVKSAQESVDSQLVRNLNTAVSLELTSTGKQKTDTAYEAMSYAKANGYDVAVIVAKSDNKIAWSKETGLFVLIDTVEGTAIFPTTNGTDNLVVNGNEVNYFIISSKMPATDSNETKYSVYAGYGWTETTININGVGFDAGDAESITSVNYTNDTGSKKDVVIRTNSDKTTLKIDAADDTVRHYDVCGIVDVIKTANASYHEYGNVKYIENDYGHVVIESGATVETVVLTASSDMTNHPATLENNGGTITNNYATTNAVATANNAETKNVQLVLQPVSSSGNVLAEGSDDVASAIDTVKAKAAAEAITATLSSEKDSNGKQKYATRIGTKPYETFQDAINAATNGDTIVLLEDITKNTYNDDSAVASAIAYVSAKNIDINLNGHTITNTCSGKYSYGIVYDDASIGKVYNGTIITHRCGIQSSCGSNLTLENVTVVQTISGSETKDSHKHVAVSAGYGSTLTISSGSYTGDYALETFPTGGTIIVNGGTFIGRDYLLYMYNPSQNHNYGFTNTKIVINNGTFDGSFGFNNSDAALAGYQRVLELNGGTFTVAKTGDNVDTIKAYVVSGKTITINDESYTKE